MHVNQVKRAVWLYEPAVLYALIVLIDMLQSQPLPLLLGLQLWREHLRDAQEVHEDWIGSLHVQHIRSIAILAQAQRLHWTTLQGTPQETHIPARTYLAPP